MIDRRLFVAFPVSQDIVNISLRAQGHFPDVSVRWVEPVDLHLTVVAPWTSKDFEEDKKIFMRVTQCIRPFTIHFGIVEPGPTIIAPRLIWIKGKADGPYAAALHKQLTRDFDRTHDFKKWVPHITIGRFHKDSSITSPVRTIYEKVDVKERISRISLMESHSISQKTTYSMVAESDLKL